MNNVVNLKQLTSLARFSTEYSNLSDDYVFTHFTSAPESASVGAWNERYGGPLRIDGMSWLLCLEGGMELDINLTPCTLGPNCLVVTTPGSIINVKGLLSGKIDCYALFVSSDFMRDINFDLNVISSFRPAGQTHEPMMELSPDDVDRLRKYFDLLRLNPTMEGTSMYAKPIARCLIAALTYQMMGIYNTRIKDIPKETPQNSRRMSYVHSFMDLVHRYHRRERSVAFYADHLFISPKYLSLIIKEQTGRSAAQIIDSFVILEAKNLLRFSGKNIQQVAYELNFPNQSSFGKYFKHLTGMSPSEYQRS
ncbi:MAG: helix-turn-helix domain-containing protein [Muribaculaceae bacterium]|nr:helix-turn-helix domain-containing protein [Muribaculaceae bacterium]